MKENGNRLLDEEKYYNEGKDAEYRFVIANMFNNNYGIFDVCDVTGLSLDKVNEYTSEREDALTLDEHRMIMILILFLKLQDFLLILLTNLKRINLFF